MNSVRKNGRANIPPTPNQHCSVFAEKNSEETNFSAERRELGKDNLLFISSFKQKMPVVLKNLFFLEEAQNSSRCTQKTPREIRKGLKSFLSEQTFN